jgi:hypothetical protein
MVGFTYSAHEIQPQRSLGMAKRKLTKTLALRERVLSGFLLKVTPTGRKIFLLASVANDGQRRKPAIGRVDEISVEQARGIAQDWLDP